MRTFALTVAGIVAGIGVLAVGAIVITGIVGGTALLVIAGRLL